MCACVCVCVCIYTHTHTHTYIYIYVCIITGNIKSLLKIQIKSRHDSFTDQFHRILMVKVCMAASLLLRLTSFKDTVNCIVPKDGKIDKDYVNQACWINGKFLILIFS